MIVGVDLDNTIVDYEAVFRETAIAAGLVERSFEGSKHELREALRARPGGEARWQWLQAQAYGPGLARATAFPHVDAFAAACRRFGIPLYVVSHKTEYATADPGGVNLRDAAAAWLARTFQAGTFAGVFFEGTREEKIARIASLRCTHFVDDLAEVFAEPGFPPETARWLFDPPDSQPRIEAERFAGWDELVLRLTRERQLWSLASALAGEPVDALVRRGGGGNNALYQARLGPRRYALKLYGVPDERGRLGREFASLEFLARAGIDAVPAAIARDPAAGAALYEWIDGAPLGAPAPGDVSKALAFIERLHAARLEPGAEALEAAAEAGLRCTEVWEQIEGRARALRPVPELAAFLATFSAEFERQRQRMTAARDPGAELPASLRTLSPSDFGFHNALRRGGELVFLDFEYFGWDDPVKLAADFALHPGMALEAADKKTWLDGTRRVFGQDTDFRGRLEAFFPTYALKWCLILLNEFRSEVWQRRVAARPHLSWEAAKAAQLAKASALLERVARNELVDAG